MAIGLLCAGCRQNDPGEQIIAATGVLATAHGRVVVLSEKNTPANPTWLSTLGDALEKNKNFADNDTDSPLGYLFVQLVADYGATHKDENGDAVSLWKTAHNGRGLRYLGADPRDINDGYVEWGPKLLFRVAGEPGDISDPTKLLGVARTLELGFHDEKGKPRWHSLLHPPSKAKTPDEYDFERQRHGFLSVSGQLTVPAARTFNRPWLRRQVENFVARVARREVGAPRYLCLTADPFFGKSWFAWSLREGGPLAGHRPVIHSFRRSDGNLDRLDSGIRLVCSQLCDQHNVREPGREDDSWNILMEVLKKVSAKLGPGEAQLVILDGLDETFGPLAVSGERAAELYNRLPKPGQMPPGIAFFLTTRPENPVTELGNETICQSVQLSNADLIADGRRAIQHWNDDAEFNLTPQFMDLLAQRTEGLVGLIWGFYFRPECREELETSQQDPTRIPDGFREHLKKLWAQIAKAPLPPDHTGGPITASQRGNLLTLLALTGPISLDVLLDLLEAAKTAAPQDLRPSEGLDVAQLQPVDIRTVVGNLAAQLFGGKRRDSEELHYFHASLPDFFLETRTVEASPRLPSPEEIRWLHRMLSAASQRLWSEAASPARTYSLRRLTHHLHKLKDLKTLVELSHETQFLLAQDALDPRLAFETIWTSAKVARELEAIDPARFLELSLSHADRAESLRSRETPLQAFRSQGSKRALNLIGLLHYSEDRVLNYLMLAQALVRQHQGVETGKVPEQAAEALNRVEASSPLLDGWQAEAAVVMLRELLACFPDRCADIAGQILEPWHQKYVDPSWDLSEDGLSATQGGVSNSRHGVVADKEREETPALSSLMDGPYDISFQKAENSSQIAWALAHEGTVAQVEHVLKTWDTPNYERGVLIVAAFVRVGRFNEIRHLVRARINDNFGEFNGAFIIGQLAPKFVDAGKSEELGWLIANTLVHRDRVLGYCARSMARAGELDRLRALCPSLQTTISRNQVLADTAIALAEAVVPNAEIHGRCLDKCLALIELIDQPAHLVRVVSQAAPHFVCANRTAKLVSLVHQVSDEKNRAELFAAIAVAFGNAGQIEGLRALDDATKRDHWGLGWPPRGQRQEAKPLISPEQDDQRMTFGRLVRELIMETLPFTSKTTAADAVDSPAGFGFGIYTDEAAVGLINAYAVADDLSESVALLRWLKHYYHQPMALAQVAPIFARAERLDDVLELVREIQARPWGKRDDRVVADLVSKLAPIFAKAGRLDDIIEAAARIEGDAPRVKALGSLARFVAERGQYDKALEWVRPALEGAAVYPIRHLLCVPEAMEEFFGFDVSDRETEWQILVAIAPAFAAANRLDDIQNLLTNRPKYFLGFALPGLAPFFWRAGRLDNILEFIAANDELKKDTFYGGEKLESGIHMALALAAAEDDMLDFCRDCLARIPHEKFKSQTIAAVAAKFANVDLRENTSRLQECVRNAHGLRNEVSRSRAFAGLAIAVADNPASSLGFASHIRRDQAEYLPEVATALLEAGQRCVDERSRKECLMAFLSLFDYVRFSPRDTASLIAPLIKAWPETGDKIASVAVSYALRLPMDGGARSEP